MFTSLQRVSLYTPFQHVPNFGLYKQKREEITSEQKAKDDLLSEKYVPVPLRPAAKTKFPVPQVKVQHRLYPLYYYIIIL